MKLKDSKMNQRLLACFIWIALCCGCTQSEVVIDNKPKKGEEVSACLRLNILSSTITNTRSMSFTKGTTETDSVSVTPDDNVTKSTTDPGEAADKEILNLWVGQYNATGEMVAEEYFSSLPTQENVNLPLKRIEGTSHVWVVTNAGNLQGKASTENALKALTTSNAFTDDGLPVSNLCMMTGMWSGTITENISADILLKRSVAKIKFTYSVGGANFSFTPATLELSNVPVQMKYIGDETPVQLSGDENFKTYTVASPGSSGTHYWYIPENPAGTGSNTGDIATNKIGEGVSHATCIRLTGEAVQDGVTYGDVVFTLYPGKGNNDYNIVRNGLYTIDVALTGIDFSDKRVTVGTVPEMQDPDMLGAEIGATGVFQVTTRPGMPWSFVIPNWLSAVVGNQTYESGTRLDFIGPYKVNLQTTTANPYAETRETSFTVGEKQITVRQAGSTVSNVTETIAAEEASNLTSSFIATAGLNWVANVTNGNWITLATTSGGPATEAAQSVSYNVAVNPSSSVRSGEITVRAGDVSTGPTGTITINQAAASLTASVTPTTALAATPDASGTLTYQATKGLPLSITAPDWLTLTGEAPETTTGDEQTIGYKTKSLNLNSTANTGNISVKAGEMTEDLAVTQSGSTFTVDKTEIELENTATSGSVTVTGTSGLPWTVSPNVETSGITPATTSATATGSGQTLTFTATENTGGAREATFTIAVTGGNHSKAVKVKQKEGLSVITLTIDQSVLTSYRTKTTDMKLYPPFDYDGSNRLPNGSSFDGTATMTGSYTIQVEKGRKADNGIYATMQSYCSSLEEDGLSDWRIPTLIELYAIFINKAKIGSTGASAFFNSSYWSSSVYNDTSSSRCTYYFISGLDGINVSNTNGAYYVRCVRDI